MFAVVQGELVSIPRTFTVTVRVVLGGVLLAVFQAAYFASAAFISVGLTTLTVMVLVTVLITLGAALAERRPVPAPAVGSVLIAVVGLFLLLGGVSGGLRPIGVVLAFVSATGFAVLSLDRRDLPAGLSRSGFTGLSFLTGGLLLLPAGLVAGMAVPLRPDVVGTLFYLGLMPTALAYGAYFSGIHRAGATASVVAVLLEPLTATLLAGVLLGERLSLIQGAGAAMVLVAVVLQAAAARTV